MESTGESTSGMAEHGALVSVGVPSLQKILDLLKTKDDTARFVGLALLKTVLDNSPELRQDEESITALWANISSSFLDRLLRTGTGDNGENKDAKEMLEVGVSVLHTFAKLLPDATKAGSKFYNRIPLLVACLTYTSGETEESILQTILSLVSQPAGAAKFKEIEDLSPLTELAPSRPMVLNIFTYAWLQQQSSPGTAEGKQRLGKKIDTTIAALVASFKGADAAPFLAFLADLLRKLDPKIVPHNPQWLSPVVAHIRNLVTSRPTQYGRPAYTNLCATLLHVYPIQAPRLLFNDAPTTSSRTATSSIKISDSTPFSFLLVSLMLVDLRSSFPTLLEQLNSPTYPALSTRLTSAFDTVTNFISYLMRSLDSPNSSSLTLSPSNLLSLRKTLSETMADTISYLRDRYDASVAGAYGLDPSARTGPAHMDEEHMTVTWDSKTDTVETDNLILSATRALALWLREDDNDMLRKESAALMDLFVDLYRSSTKSAGRDNHLDFRQAILVALEGITAVEEGRDALLEHDGWKVLSDDFLSILASTSTSNDEAEAARGVEIIRVLLQIVESETPHAKEEWTDLVTKVASWDVPDAQQATGVVEFQVAAMQLVAGIIEHSHPSVRRRLKNTFGDIKRLAEELREKKVEEIKDDGLTESLEEVLDTLAGMKIDGP